MERNHKNCIEICNYQPMTVNQVWQGRRFKTGAYKRYEKELLMVLPKRDTIFGKVRTTYEITVPNKVRRDVSNFVKPLEDILVKKGYFTDDSEVVELIAKKKYGSKWNIKISIEKV